MPARLGGSGQKSTKETGISVVWLIVGLGNPGPKYELTRHNYGFLVVDELARRLGKLVRTPECQSLTCQGVIEGIPVLLAKPQTFMNISGVAVAALTARHPIVSPAQVLVISDDLALPFGRLRIRREGSAGGHNGLKSIIEKLGTQSFPRLRLGIAPDHPMADTRDYVLGTFTRSEQAELPATIDRAADAATVLFTRGIEAAMADFN
jgi:PTH1 family peptidyl-tRNA hydrolase